MDPAGLFSIVVLSATGLFLLTRRWGSPSPALRMRQARATTIRNVRDGEVVKVVGRVTADAPLIAPITERPCVSFRIDAADGLAGVGPGSGQLFAHARSCPFVLDDGTGRAFVDPRTPKAVIEAREHQRVGVLERAELDRRLAARSLRAERASREQVSFRELAVPVGERVAVLGRARHDGVDVGGTTAYREGLPPRVVLDPLDDGALLVYADAWAFD